MAKHLIIVIATSWITFAYHEEIKLAAKQVPQPVREVVCNGAERLLSILR